MTSSTAVMSSRTPRSFPAKMADRSTGASSSPRSASWCRSRSNAGPRASVPENATAIHRMPGAAPSTGCPARTKANEKTSTHEMAKNSVVDHHLPAPRLDRQVLAHHEPGHPQEVSRHAISPVRGAWVNGQRGAVNVPERAAAQRQLRHAARSRSSSTRSSSPSTASRSCVASSTIRRSRPSALQPPGQGPARRLVEPGERLVEQHQPRLVQQRPLQREPLPHAAREPLDQIVRAARQAGPLESGGRARRAVAQTVQPPEELEVLAGGQLAVQLQLVREESQPGAERLTGVAGRPVAVQHLPARRLNQRGEQAEQGRLAGAVRAQQADQLPGVQRHGHPGERAPAAVMAGNVRDRQPVEIERGRARDRHQRVPGARGGTRSEPGRTSHPQSPRRARGTPARAPRTGRRRRVAYRVGPILPARCWRSILDEIDEQPLAPGLRAARASPSPRTAPAPVEPTAPQQPNPRIASATASVTVLGRRAAVRQPRQLDGERRAGGDARPGSEQVTRARPRLRRAPPPAAAPATRRSRRRPTSPPTAGPSPSRRGTTATA